MTILTRRTIPVGIAILLLATRGAALSEAVIPGVGGGL